MPTYIFSYNNPIPVLDEEFDKAEMLPAPSDHTAHAVSSDDLAWDDQLDSGEEMSL